MIDPQTQANKWLKKLLRNQGDDDDDAHVGRSNLSGKDFIVINATTPDDDNKDDGEGMPKKKGSSSQKKFEQAI